MSITTNAARSPTVALDRRLRGEAIGLVQRLLSPYDRTCAGQLRLQVRDPDRWLSRLRPLRNAEEIVDHLLAGKSLVFTPAVVMALGQYPIVADDQRYGVLTPQPHARRTYSDLSDFIGWAHALANAR